MPLYISAGLPGPFRYVARVDGRHAGPALYWLVIGWWWLLLKWMAIGLAWCTVALYRLAVRAREVLTAAR